MAEVTWLGEIIKQYEAYKGKCERAATQVSDDDFFKPLDQAHNSIGMLMKHLGGNHRSRWHNFLTSDGEKSDRDRESEFVTVGETRASVMDKWDGGWETAFTSLRALQPDDLDRTITIRGEPLPVKGAILRNLAHVAYHTGQIVLIARNLVGENWKFLSIPPGKSKEYNESMRQEHGDWSS